MNYYRMFLATVALAVGALLMWSTWGRSTLRVDHRGASAAEPIRASRANEETGFRFKLHGSLGEPVNVRFLAVADEQEFHFLMKCTKTRVVELPPGRYRVTAPSITTGERVWPPVIRVRSSNRGRIHPLWIETAGTLSVSVVPHDADDLPKGMRILVRGENRYARNVGIDDKGHATLSLPVGQYRCELHRGGHDALELPARVVSRTITALSFCLPAAPPRYFGSANVRIDGEPASRREVAQVVVEREGRSGVLKFVSRGVYRGELYPHPTVPATGSKCVVHGYTFSRVEKTSPQVEDKHDISFEVDVERFPSTARMRLVDEEQAPIAGEKLGISVRMLRGQSFSRSVFVTSGADGRFSIPHVALPFAFHVTSSRPGFRYRPNRDAQMAVRRKGTIVVIREARHRVFLVPPSTPQLRAALHAHWSRGVVLDILPLSVPRERFSPRWLHGGRSMTQAARDEYEASERIPLEDLPEGRYLATLFVPQWGTINTEFTIDEKQPTTLVSLSGRFDSTRIRGRFEEGAGDRLVMDGYVPFSTGVRYYRLLVWYLEGMTLGACAHVKKDGSFELSHSNPDNKFVTVLYSDGGAHHVRKSDLGRGRTRLAHDPRDRRVFGRIIAEDFDDLVVNLTSMNGGEDSTRRRLIPKTSELAERRVAKDGTFSIDGVTPGFYVMSVARLHYTNDQTRIFRIIRRVVRRVDVRDADQRVEINLIRE